MLTADSVVLGLVLFFAAWGAVTGAARQLGQLGAIGLAYLGVKYLVPIIAAPVGTSMGLSGPAAKLVTSALLFAGIIFVGRALLTRMMEGVLVGKDAKTRAPDRWLGFLLGGLKAAAACYVVLACIVYAQENWVFGGRRLNLVSRKSWAYEWVRSHDALWEPEQLPQPIKKR